MFFYIIGQYCPQGSSSPIECDLGQFCPLPGMDLPEGPCSAGYYCNDSSTTATPTGIGG